MPIVTDSLGRVTKYNYDKLGRVVSIVNPLGKSTSNRYGNNGLLTSYTTYGGTSVTYTYDEQADVTLFDTAFSD